MCLPRLSKADMAIAPIVQRYKLGQEPKPLHYWLTQTPEARVSAVEEARKEFHGGDYATQSGFSRVYRIVKR